MLICFWKILGVFLVTPSIAYNVYWYDKTQTLQNRQLMVHLFEWKWIDIAQECEDFLQHYGYGAVQVSPPMEHIYVNDNNNLPWWVRYQPVSYALDSRSGNEAQFKDMVSRCNKVGIRIIVDAVMNHMVGIGQKSGSGGESSSGSSTFDGTHGVESFPAVPYAKGDFNDFRCDGDIQNSDYQYSAEHVKNCRLVGLLDLNQGSDSVRQKMVGYLNKLISYGVAGFRFDASKHMWPDDLKLLLNSMNDLRSDIFGTNQRPFAVHEVIDQGGEAVKCGDYVTIGRYTNFNYGSIVSAAAQGNFDWKNLAHLAPGFGYGNYEDHDVLNFIDNHDNQRHGSVVTYKDGYRYQLAIAFMLAWPYGYVRVMSSFYFTDTDAGPPNAGASNRFATTSPLFNSDGTCRKDSGWVCEHRWVTHREMAKFHSACEGTAATEVATDNQRIAFARESSGFFALNAQGNVWSKNFITTLPAGDYCNHYDGGIENGKCVATTVTVNADGTAFVKVPPNSVVALSTSSRIGGAAPTKAPPINYQRTVVFLKKDTAPGQYVFIRGGTSAANNGNCLKGPFQQSTDPCAIPMVHSTNVPFVFAEYLSWSQYDSYLDFEGAEERQGTHDGDSAFGTPLAYSTNDKNAVEYQPYNKYGPDYWMVQLEMDCSKTETGWFELKGYETPDQGWESNISQGTCSGAVGGKAPFSSINHVAKCGAVNVFVWGQSSCTIDSI